MTAIAPLKPADRARWGEMWLAYQRFYQVVIPDEVTDATWQRMRTGRVHGLAACDVTGRLIGFVHYLFHEDTWSKTPACYLQDLYVDPDARGSGCGRALIQAVAQASRAAGANSPYWLTHETNATARLLYDRLAKNHGFIQYAYVDASP